MKPMIPKDKKIKSTMNIDPLLIVTPFVGFCNCSMFCCALLCIHSRFALLAYLVHCDCCVALPHGATGLSAVCDCGIS